MGFKYIMMNVQLKGKGEDSVEKLLPIIFPDILVHADVYAALRRCDSLKNFHVAIHSAGECQIDCLDASGKSETLMVSADPEDEKTIQMYPYFHGIKS